MFNFSGNCWVTRQTDRTNINEVEFMVLTNSQLADKQLRFILGE